MNQLLNSKKLSAYNSKTQFKNSTSQSRLNESKEVWQDS